MKAGHVDGLTVQAVAHSATSRASSLGVESAPRGRLTVIEDGARLTIVADPDVDLLLLLSPFSRQFKLGCYLWYKASEPVNSTPFFRYQ